LDAGIQSFRKGRQAARVFTGLGKEHGKGFEPNDFAQMNGVTWENTLKVDKQWVWRDVTSDMSDVILAKRFGL
jgi:hypothetical protein